MRYMRTCGDIYEAIWGLREEVPPVRWTEAVEIYMRKK